jgi:hypothetical protein
MQRSKNNDGETSRNKKYTEGKTQDTEENKIFKKPKKCLFQNFKMNVVGVV